MSPPGGMSRWPWATARRAEFIGDRPKLEEILSKVVLDFKVRLEGNLEFRFQELLPDNLYCISPVPNSAIASVVVSDARQNYDLDGPTGIVQGLLFRSRSYWMVVHNYQDQGLAEMVTDWAKSIIAQEAAFTGGFGAVWSYHSKKHQVQVAYLYHPDDQSGKVILQRLGVMACPLPDYKMAMGLPVLVSSSGTRDDQSLDLAKLLEKGGIEYDTAVKLDAHSDFRDATFFAPEFMRCTSHTRIYFNELKPRELFILGVIRDESEKQGEGNPPSWVRYWALKNRDICDGRRISRNGKPYNILQDSMNDDATYTFPTWDNRQVVCSPDMTVANQIIKKRVALFIDTDVIRNPEVPLGSPLPTEPRWYRTDSGPTLGQLVQTLGTLAKQNTLTAVHLCGYPAEELRSTKPGTRTHGLIQYESILSILN